VKEGGESTLLERRLDVPAIDRTGREFPVELTIWRDDLQPSACFYAFVHDISERRRSERLLRAQHAVTRVFAQAKHSDEAMRGLLGAWRRDGLAAGRVVVAHARERRVALPFRVAPRGRGAGLRAGQLGA
jgi:hypothetical protein